VFVLPEAGLRYNHKMPRCGTLLAACCLVACHLVFGYEPIDGVSNGTDSAAGDGGTSEAAIDGSPGNDTDALSLDGPSNGSWIEEPSGIRQTLRAVAGSTRLFAVGTSGAIVVR
jgi:hypothetical protein